MTSYWPLTSSIKRSGEVNISLTWKVLPLGAFIYVIDICNWYEDLFFCDCIIADSNMEICLFSTKSLLFICMKSCSTPFYSMFIQKLFCMEFSHYQWYYLEYLIVLRYLHQLQHLLYATCCSYEKIVLKPYNRRL